MTPLRYQGQIALDERRRALLDMASAPHWGDGAAAVIHTGLSELGLTPLASYDASDAAHALRTKLLGSPDAAPELASVLREANAPPALIDDVEAAGTLLRADHRPILVDRAAWDEATGVFEVSLVQPDASASIGIGDVYFSGLALHGNAKQGRLRVAPRVVRRICDNGMLQPLDETTREGTYTRDARGGAHGDLATAFSIGLSETVVYSTLERIADLPAGLVHDPLEALALRGARVPGAARARVVRAFEQQEDSSAYGALNALTQTARDAHSVAERVVLEQTAGVALQGADRSAGPRWSR